MDAHRLAVAGSRLQRSAEALGLQFYPGSEPRQQLLDYLCQSSILLVLDNFAHLLDGVVLRQEQPQQ